MKSNYEYGVDLHIHTPASSDYKGIKTENEFIRILNQARENNIELVCIADHNTINGYKKFMDIKKQYSHLISSLHKRNDVDSNFLSKIEYEYSLFCSIHILMGIEFSVSPGVHYIVVYKEDVSTSEMDDFLDYIIHDKIAIDTGKDNYMLDINSRQLFDVIFERFENRCFIYAPHCDSQSGVIEALKSLGTERLNILKDERLLCLGFNKETSRQYILNSLMPQADSERRTAITFIQDSDFHGRTGEYVGSQHFLLERDLGKICYLTLYNRLISSEYLKTTLDTALERYQEFKKENIVIDFGKLPSVESSDEIKDSLSKTVCAIINTNKGCIQFAVESSNFSAEYDISTVIDSIISVLQEKIENLPESISYTLFQVSKSKQLLVMMFKKTERLSLYNGICYILSDNYEPRIAVASEVESIVARRIYERYGKSKDVLIDEIMSSTSRIKNCLISFSNSYKIEKFVSPFSSYKIKYHKSIILTEDIKEQIINDSNGSSSGNVCVLYGEYLKLHCGRYDNSYLRYSPPLFEIALQDLQSKVNYIEEDSIIIIPSGGVYVVKKSTKLMNSVPCASLSFNDAQINYKVMAAYLKSSFLSWLLCKILDYDDVFEFINVTGGKNFPIIDNLLINDGVMEEIAGMVDKILISEESFLIEYRELVKSDMFEEANNLVERHNTICDEYMRDIDNILFSLLHIDKDSIIEIYNDLRNLKIYDYNGLNSLI